MTRQPATRAVIGAAGTAVTVGLALLGVAVPFRLGMDAGAYVAVITLGLLVTLAGIQLATPRRRAAR